MVITSVAFLLPLPLLAGAKDKRLPSVVLVQSGRPVATIYIDATEWKEAPDLKTAVEELTGHLGKMSGAELTVMPVGAAEEVKPPAIVLGQLAAKMGIKAPASIGGVESPDGGGFHLKTADRSFFIAGDTPKGTLNGVYEVLERLGCAWVMPGEGGVVIPERKTVELDGVDLEQRPAFAIATLSFSESRLHFSEKDQEILETWKRRMRLDTDKAAAVKSVPLLALSGAHAWGFVRRKYAEEFQADPEMLPLIKQPDGSFRREGKQLETANPKVADLMVRYVRDQFAEKKWPKDKKIALSVGPADGGGFSESPETLAIAEGRVDAMSGLTDRTNEPIFLANRMFEKLGDEFPNLYLGQLLYSYHSGGPSKDYPADPRFVLGVADIGFSRYHSTVDEKSPSRFYYRQTLDQWNEVARKQGNPRYFGGYTWNLAEAILPYTKVRIWGEDIPYYHRNGYLLPSMKGTPAWAVLGPSDYIYARMAWNPARSWKEELAKYSSAAFGEKAAPIMESIYLKQIERQHSARQEAGSFFAYPLIYDAKFVQAILAEFGRAEEAADTAARKSLVAMQRHPWEQLVRFLSMRASVQRFDYGTAVRLHREMLAAHDAIKGENIFSVARFGRGFLESRYKQELEQGLRYSSGNYQIAYQVPERLPVRFDPHNTGESMRLFAADYNLDQLVKIATSSSTWDAQGLPWALSGTVWYYFDFDGALLPKEGGVGLFLGRLEDEGIVWVNEKPAGSSSGFSRPHLYDLTDLVNREGKNRIAVAVRKNKRNEIGIGGLMAPSFVFTGPRIAEPKPAKAEELLPGGVQE